MRRCIPESGFIRRGDDLASNRIGRDQTAGSSIAATTRASTAAARHNQHLTSSADGDTEVTIPRKLVDDVSVVCDDGVSTACNNSRGNGKHKSQR